MTDRTAKLEIDGKKIELPIYASTNGPDVVDVGKLTGQGYFTYDPGFVSTAACDSEITFIDGDQGILLHRGYPIEQLAEKSNHLELSYLLLNGELPSESKLDEFTTNVKSRAAVDSQFKEFFKGFKPDAHPMAIMCAATGALAAGFHNSLDIDNAKDRNETSLQLIGKIPTMAAISYKNALGEDFVEPREDLDYAENFLHMMFAKKGEDYKVSPTIAKAMDRIFLLHADHEQLSLIHISEPTRPY